jgi:hypothetical protein
LGCPKTGPAPNISPSASRERDFDFSVGALHIYRSRVPRGSDVVPGEGWRSLAMVILKLIIYFYYH